jgi:hypothetical protein
MKPQQTIFTVEVYDVKFDVPIQYTQAYPAPFDYDQPSEQAEYEILGIFVSGDVNYDLYGVLTVDVVDKIEEGVKEQFIDFINE